MPSPASRAATQPRSLGQCCTVATAVGAVLDLGQDRLRLAQVTGADQRPDLGRAPPERRRVVAIDLRHGQRQGRAV